MKALLEILKALYAIRDALRGENNNDGGGNSGGGSQNNDILIKIANTFVDFNELVYENDGKYYVKKDIKFSDIYNVESDKVLEFFKYMTTNHIHNNYLALRFNRSIYEENDIRQEGSNISFEVLEYYTENNSGWIESNIGDFNNLTKDTIIYHKDEEINFSTQSA